jgi:lysophospholipase L1-like esterase
VHKKVGQPARLPIGGPVTKGQPGMVNREILAERDRRTRVPRPHRIRSMPAALIAVAGLLLAACSAAATGRAPSPGPYVALGDSYTSGVGIPDQIGIPAGCARSNHNYPTLVARYLKLDASLVRDASCSGAKIANLVTSQTTDDGTNPAQLSALSADTALVTLGIGGNDLDFVGVLTRCVELDAPGILIHAVRRTADVSTPCRAHYTAGGTDQIRQGIQDAGTEIAAMLVRIHHLAPHARVYVVGYPDLLPADDGAACSRILGITAGDVGYLNSEEVQLNTTLEQRAQAAGESYVDTYARFRGHDACTAPATRWIEPLLQVENAAAMHPNADGQHAIASAVEHAITTRH